MATKILAIFVLQMICYRKLLRFPQQFFLGPFVLYICLSSYLLSIGNQKEILKLKENGDSSEKRLAIGKQFNVTVFKGSNELRPVRFKKKQ